MGERKAGGNGDAGDHTEPWLVTWGRRLLLVVLLGFGVWLLWDGLPQVCGQEVADASVVTICRPLAVSDPRVWLYVLLVGLLLFPELSELELAGVLTLRRRLDEVGQDARDLKAELADIRLQATTLSQANATNQTAVNVDARQQQSGAAQAEVDAIDAELDEVTATGAYLQLAFKAGLAGLSAVLPAAADGAGLVCYTLRDDGRLEPIYQSDPDAEVEALTDTVNESVGQASVTEGPRFVAATAYAQDPRGHGIVGAVVLLVPKPVTRASGGFAEVDLAAAAETAAGAYSHLLVELLGEQPRSTVPGISAQGEAP